MRRKIRAKVRRYGPCEYKRGKLEIGALDTTFVKKIKKLLYTADKSNYPKSILNFKYLSI